MRRIRTFGGWMPEPRATVCEAQSLIEQWLEPLHVGTLRVHEKPTFRWKYVVGGYKNGAATFNGKPLVAGTKTSFLFRTFGPK